MSGDLLLALLIYACLGSSLLAFVMTDGAGISSLNRTIHAIVYPFAWPLYLLTAVRKVIQERKS